MKERKADSHKGENGVILIIGGSKEYVGAPALCGLAALRVGADLAIIAAPAKTAYAINSLSPDLITLKLGGDQLSSDHCPKLIKKAGEADVVVIGPGLGTSQETRKAVNQLCSTIDKPKVIDADALKALEEVPDNCVLTPHAREFEILFQEKPGPAVIKKKASPNQIILLKGPTDLVSDGKTLKENQGGNPGMTVGGTGDVLAGIIAGLIAQEEGLMQSAWLGARINGRIGDFLMAEKGYGFLASDFLEIIPLLLKD